MTDPHPDHEPAHTRPRWVTASAVAAAVIVAIFLVAHLAGGGMSHLHSH